MIQQPEIPKGKPCNDLVTQNISNIRNGRELNAPLSYLNRSCEFRKVWENIHLADNIAERKAHMKAYNQRPEVKERQKAYRKAYNQRPEVKARYQRPEVKARKKAYLKAYRKKLKEEK